MRKFVIVIVALICLACVVDLTFANQSYLNAKQDSFQHVNSLAYLYCLC